MELSREMLQYFSCFTPDDTAVYHVESGALKTFYLSQNIPSLLSMSREEYLKITEKDAMDLTIPQDRAGLVGATLQCIQSGKPFDYYYRVYHNTRGFDWVHVHAHVCGSMEGSPLIIAQFSNMTKEGDIYQQVLNTSDRQAMVFDRKSHEILYANEIAIKNSTLNSHNLLDQFCFSFLHGKAAPCENCTMDEAEKVGVVERIAYDKTTGKWQEINGRNINWCNHEAFLLYIKDVTSLKNAEFEIAKSKQIYDDAAQSAKLIIWTYYPEQHRVVMIPNGYTGEICRRLHFPGVIENVPDSLIKYVDERDRDAFYGIYRTIDNGAPNAECEFRFQLPGQIVPQYERMIFRRITDENGHLISAHCCGQNISLEKKAQEEYERIRKRLSSNLAGSVGSFELNLTRNKYIGGSSPYPEVEKAVKQETADAHFAAVADSVTDLRIRKKFSDLFNCAKLTELYRNNQKKVEIDYPVRTSRGGIMWIHGIVYMIQNPNTDEIEGITYCTDITREKRERDIVYQLAKEECDYIGIINTSDHTYELYRGIWNDENVAVGVPVDYDALRKQDAAKYLTPEEGRALIAATDFPVLKKELETKSKYIVAYNCINPNESSYSLKKQIRFSWLNEEKREIIAIQSDVTDLYRREQEHIFQLERANRNAEEANQAKTEFLSRMSHDMRTPLNGIIGMTYLTREMTLPEKAQENLRKIDISSRFLLGLINDVLDMSKAESGKIELHPEPYPVDEFTDYMNSIIAPLCAERRQTFSFEPVIILTDVIPLFDKLRINQVVFNLLSNAVKYTQEGGKIRYRVIEKKTDDSHMTMHLEIMDNGIGMSEEFQKVLFEPFTQENRSDSSEMRGTGLGLSITKKLIDTMGGTITVKSRLGEGTTFFVDLLLDCIPVKTENAEQNKDTEQEGSLTGKHILLCEDHPLNQEIAKAVLEEEHMIVTIADDGEAGVKEFNGSSIGYFDCILMDIHMPVMDGYESTKAIRSLKRADAKTVPILAMTADAFTNDIQKCLQAGMNGHIAKPIDPKLLSKELLKVFTCKKS